MSYIICTLILLLTSIMGIYDQIHGACPHCGHFIGRQKGADGYSGIQIKDWITRDRMTTYDFYVGDNVPYIVNPQTGKPDVHSFYEHCYSCDKDFEIPFDIRLDRIEGKSVTRVYILPFKKC
jgi:hypothetical protein